MGNKGIKRIQTTGTGMILCRLRYWFGGLYLDLLEIFIFQGLLRFWCYGIVGIYGGNDEFCVEFGFSLILQGNLRFFAVWFYGMDFESGEVGRLDFVGIMGWWNLFVKSLIMFGGVE